MARPGGEGGGLRGGEGGQDRREARYLMLSITGVSRTRKSRCCWGFCGPFFTSPRGEGGGEKGGNRSPGSRTMCSSSCQQGRRPSQRAPPSECIVGFGGWGGRGLFGLNFSRQSHCIAHAALEPEILLPQSPQCEDCKCVPPWLARTLFLDSASQEEIASKVRVSPLAMNLLGGPYGTWVSRT